MFDNRFDQFSGESSQCKRECCQRLVEQSTPYQSCGKSILSATIQDGSDRSLNPKWYKDFKWLHYCASQNKVFCHYCRQCYVKGQLTMTKKYEDAFVREGFNNWKKASNDIDSVSSIKRHNLNWKE